MLRTYRLGEADRIVVLFTRAHGKVRAVAKGVRKTKSRFGSRLEPTSHVALLLYEGRGELDIVTQAETIDHFRAIRDDLDRFSRARPRCSRRSTSSRRSGSPTPASTRCCSARCGRWRRATRRSCCRGSSGSCWRTKASGPWSTRASRAAPRTGSWPSTWRKVACSAPTTGGGRRSVEGAVDLLRLILGGQLGAALNEQPSLATEEVEHLATRAMEHHLERRLRSVSLLDLG